MAKLSNDKTNSPADVGGRMERLVKPSCLHR